MIKAVIFDYFGVIRVDPTCIAYRELGGDDEADRAFLQRTMNAADAGQIPSAAPLIAQRLGVSEATWEKVSHHATPFDHTVLDYILDLRKFYKTALLTNISQGELPEWFKPHEPETYFDGAFASGDIGVAKPDVRAFHIAAAHLHVSPEECVMVDDRTVNCAGARDAGMHAITYVSLAQLKDELIAMLRKENKLAGI